MARGVFRTGARRGLDRAVYESWRASVRQTGPTPGRILAWQLTTDEQYAIATTGLLSIGSGDHDGGRWQHYGWHRIEHGSFDADSNSLRWTRYPDPDDCRAPDPAAPTSAGAVALREPGRLPDVFRDRVAASIAVQRFVPLDVGADGTMIEPAGRQNDRRPGVIISGRRDLSGTDNPIEWRVSLPPGVSWDTKGVSELAAEAMAGLRAAYDPDG